MSLFNKRKNKSLPVNQTLISKDAPFAFVEAYKMLRTNLKFTSIGKAGKTLLVTSAIPDEGKTTMAINLAMVMAQEGLKVLLIDCDLRNPSVHRYLGFKTFNGEGTTTLIAGQSKLLNVIQQTQFGFDAIIAGTIPPNPAELLSSNGLKAFLAEAERDYDFIICDTAPAAVVSDAAILSQSVSGVLLVVRQKFASKREVLQAKQNLQSVQANIVGTVMTRYDTTQDHLGYGSYHYRYDYGYGYGPQNKNDQIKDNINYIATKSQK